MVLRCFYRAAYLGTLGALIALGSDAYAGPLMPITKRILIAYLGSARSLVQSSPLLSVDSALLRSHQAPEISAVNAPLLSLGTTPHALLSPLMVGGCGVGAVCCFLGSAYYFSKNKVKSACLAAGGLGLSCASLYCFLKDK